VVDLRVTRIEYLKMCGDIARHNLGRLNKIVSKTHKLLKAAGRDVSEQDAYLAVEGFFDWFQGNIFIYHSSQIAEFLNEIRWSIYEYLQPEFLRSWRRTDGAPPDFPIDSYLVPPKITEPAARAMYWYAMNRSRSKPYVQRFVVHERFKRRY
jgi:hypothetical protein